MNQDKGKDKEPLVLCSYDSEHLANVVAAYLQKELTMCRDATLEVVANPIQHKDRTYKKAGQKYGRYWWCSDWIVQIPENAEHWSQFKITIDKITTAATDFVAGYLLGKSEAQLERDHDWVTSVGKAEIRKLRTRIATLDDIGNEVQRRREDMERNNQSQWHPDDTELVRHRLSDKFVVAKDEQINEMVRRMFRPYEISL